jgi:hypothetical protein
MPEGDRGRLKHVACSVGFNKFVGFYDNNEITEKSGTLAGVTGHVKDFQSYNQRVRYYCVTP